MPSKPTTNSWRFPPMTSEVRFDEKWAFVAQKEANCDRSDPADNHKGDYWDHVAPDAEHRLVVAVIPSRTGKPGRPHAPYKLPPAGLNYAVVAKRRVKGRVVGIGTRVVFGTIDSVAAALGRSKVSRSINTAFIERENGTDRHRNARKARKTYRLSKDWRYHEAVTYFSSYSDNFCWSVRTLAVAAPEGGRQ